MAPRENPSIGIVFEQTAQARVVAVVRVDERHDRAGIGNDHFLPKSFKSLSERSERSPRPLRPIPRLCALTRRREFLAS
jgi:hypothetical protein